MQKPGRPWFEFGLNNGVGFHTWEVRLATEEETPLLKKNLGRTIRYEKSAGGPRLILIDESIDSAFNRDSTVFHEILHAAWPGGIISVEGRSEEEIVSALEKRLYPLLAAHGLRWPEPRKKRR